MPREGAVSGPRRASHPLSVVTASDRFGKPHREAPPSGIRRVAVRVRADSTVVVARQDGHKQAARVLDLSIAGMHLEANDVPAYGESLTVVARLAPDADWVLLPATVRWFSGRGFGVAFHSLDERSARALSDFVDAAVSA
jgi:hypothetical protein